MGECLAGLLPVTRAWEKQLTCIALPGDTPIIAAKTTRP
jgi:hypothetical protein